MNGYNLTKAFFSFVFDNPDKVKPTHISLYMFLIEYNNKLGWVEKFAAETSLCMAGSAISSYNTFKKVLDDLESWGFVSVIEKGYNQFKCPIVALSKNDKALYKATTKAIDKAMTKHYTEHYTKQEIDSLLLNKTNKLINNKTNETKKQTNKSADADGYSFAEFWETYGKKSDRAKSEKKWLSLPLATRKKILTLLPFYLIDTPEIKYRKNPLTFLNGETWKDYEDRLKEIEIQKQSEEKYSDEEKLELQRRKRHYEISTSPLYNAVNKPGDIISFPEHLSNYFANSGLPDTRK